MWDFVCRTEERAYTGAIEEQNTEEDIRRKRGEMAEEVSEWGAAVYVIFNKHH
jgi:hypothetical protein